jgi:hypothetical protein
LRRRLLDVLVRENRALPDVAKYWDEQAAAFDVRPITVCVIPSRVLLGHSC